jgi:2-(1,2-epoxy-1,2-dihydrophenyl)acetyl-CoA isomerase
MSEQRSDVLVTRDGGVLTITLNRPDVLNAFNRAMHEALAAALKEARDPAVRVVVLTGAGRGFCVGQDLNEFREETGDVAERLRSTFNPNVAALRALEKPVIAAVNGPAAGAGLSFACACDLRVASDRATFVPAFINIGLIPDTGGSYFVARLLGYARAFEWLTSGRRLTASEAHAWGLVSEVVDDDALAERTAELASSLAAMPTRGIGMTKRLLDRAATSALAEHLEWEAQLQAAAAESDDFAEGVAAFLEKREPRFTGR